MEGLLNAGPARQAEAKASLSGFLKYIPKARSAIAAVRPRWLNAGYPADYPTVRDIEAMLAGLDRFSAAARSSNLQAIPGIYLAFNSASEQYGYDAQYICTS